MSEWGWAAILALSLTQAEMSWRLWRLARTVRELEGKYAGIRQERNALEATRQALLLRQLAVKQREDNNDG